MSILAKETSICKVRRILGYWKKLKEAQVDRIYELRLDQQVRARLDRIL
jgi:hypothetical protein